MVLGEFKEEHPSFGMIGFSRVTNSLGRNLLFGSPLDRHHETIVMRVMTAERGHHLGHDWFHGCKRLIEVEMSPMQFAQLLTTMNFGDGVPCTIRFVGDRGKIDPVPDEHISEQVMVFEDMRRDVDDLVGSMNERRRQLKSLLSKKYISKGDREEIARLSESIFLWFEEHIPFAFKSFEESAEKVVTAAKAQVEAFTLSVLVKAGMEKLKDKFGLPGGFEQNSNLPPG
jgi:hypothetical protein